MSSSFRSNYENPRDFRLSKKIIFHKGFLKQVNLFHACAAYELPVPVFRQPHGVGAPTIVGGQLAVRGQFPYQAAIIVDGQSFCGGSLISKNWVLTAEPCMSPSSTWLVILGATIREGYEPRRVLLSSKIGTRHENYDARNITNKIMNVAG